MKQQSRKAKGRRLQNYVRDKILKNFPHLKAKDVQCVENYAPGPDIILSKVGLKLVPYQWEIKNQEKMKTISISPFHKKTYILQNEKNRSKVK